MANNPYYPYEKVMTGFQTFKRAEEIPYKLLLYLMDLPDKSGYIPTDDNSLPRVRLMKYLWHDGENPLAQPLPTPAEKRSLLFDPEHPVLNEDEVSDDHPKGYRLYWQQFWGQSQLAAKTVLKCYLGRVVSPTPFISRIGVYFEITCNVNQETNTRTPAYARAYNIEQCLIEALHGVNMTGIGVIDFSKQAHGDNGSRPIADEGTHVGRRLHMSIAWAESEENEP